MFAPSSSYSYPSLNRVVLSTTLFRTFTTSVVFAATRPVTGSYSKVSLTVYVPTCRDH